MESEGSRISAFEDSKHISSILKILHNQRPYAKLCDVILKVSGEPIYAHSNVLCAASPYFDTLFSGGQDMPRAFSQRSPQIIEIHIDGDEKDGYVEAVQKIVDFMYTSIIEISQALLSQIVEIAKIMQLQKILEFCTQFQNGSKGNIPNYELHRQGSEFIFIKSGSKDVMVQTDPLVHVDGNSEVDTCWNGTKPLINARKRTQNKNTDTVITNSGREMGTKEGDISAEKQQSTETEIVGDNMELVPAKRKRGRPRKDEFHKIKIEKENTEITHVTEKPQVIQITAPPLTPAVQTVRVSARVRERILTGKYKDFSEMNGNKIKEDESEAEVRAEPVKVTEENKTRVVYECNICSHVSTSLENLNQHRSIHEGNKKHVCDVCDFSTSKTKLLLQHKREHLHAENQCSFCGWTCDSSDVNSTQFQEHLAKHVGPEPYFCPDCDLRFKTKTKLQLHLPKHSKVKPFVCDQCGAGFKWKHALKNHMIVHKDSKDYLCDFCGFSTAHKSQITAHRLIHTGETFKCSEPGCTFIATKRNYLRYHMLTHTHEKPHQCEVCGQSFSLIKNMKRHMLLHSNTRAFKCEKCSFCTTRFDKLKEHYWKQHNIGAPPGKKFRLKDYLEVKPPTQETAEDLTQNVESLEVPIGETQTFELQIEDGGIVDETSTSVTYLESSTGETYPVAITQVSGETQVAEVLAYPELDTGGYQTVYVTQVELAPQQ